MNKTIILILTFLIVLSSSIYAIDDSDFVAFFNFDNDMLDAINSYDITGAGDTYVGGLGGKNALVCNGDDFDASALNPIMNGTNGFVLFWFTPVDSVPEMFILSGRDNPAGERFYLTQKGKEIQYTLGTGEQTGTGTLVSDGERKHYGLSWNKSRVYVWENATIVDERAQIDGFITGAWAEGLDLCSFAGADNLNGILQGLAFGGNLTQAIVDGLYNNELGSFAPFTAETATPIIVNPSPETNTHNNTNITINVTHSTLLNDVTYYLYFGTTIVLNESDLVLDNAARTGDEYREYTTTISDDGVYYWKMKVRNTTSGIFSLNTTQRNWTLDTITPIITLLPGNNWKTDNTTILSPAIHNLSINVNFSDESDLYQTLINFTYDENGTSYYDRHNTSIIRRHDNFSVTIDMADFPIGNYTLILADSDPHTKTIIKDYGIKEGLFNNYLEYETEEGITIRIETLESIFGIKSVSTNKLKDRYSFKWEFWNEKTTATFRVTSSHKLEYVKSEYNAHLVTLNGVKGNWIDFNSLGLKPSNYEVKRVDDYTYEITIKDVNLKEFEFNSIGGLNIREDHYRIQLGAVVEVWVFDNFEGIAINFTANLSNTIINGTSIAGATFQNITEGNLTSIIIQSPEFNSRSIPINISLKYHNLSINLTKNMVDNCSAYEILILNYTLRDESNFSLIQDEGENIKVSITIFNSSTTTPWMEYSHEVNENNMLICISEILNDSIYRLYSVTEYETDNHVHEFDYIQNMNLSSSSNFPRNIPLYDLHSSLSTSFIITFKNNVFLPEDEAIIEIIRSYTEIGQQVTVEDGLTDEAGQTVGHFITEDVNYGFIIKKEGVVLATFSNILATCPELPCVINLNQFESITEVEDFGSFENLAYNFDFNKTERTLDLTFVVLDSTSAKIDLNATLFDHFGNNTVCQDSVTSSSGTLSCVIPQSFGNSTIRANLYMDDEYVITRYADLSIKGVDIFGYTGYFMAALLYLTLILMAISDPTAMVVFAIAGMVFSGALGLISTNKLFAFGSIIIWFVVAGVIIIWKVKKREII